MCFLDKKNKTIRLVLKNLIFNFFANYQKRHFTEPKRPSEQSAQSVSQTWSETIIEVRALPKSSAGFLTIANPSAETWCKPRPAETVTVYSVSHWLKWSTVYQKMLPINKSTWTKLFNWYSSLRCSGVVIVGLNESFASIPSGWYSLSSATTGGNVFCKQQQY